MRILSDIKALPDYRIECVFDDGTKKIADIKPLLNKEVFKPLQNPLAFAKISNRKYFIEWSDYQVDLSADTLWHLGNY